MPEELQPQPIDFGHLERQTMGSLSLKKELLDLFLAQSLTLFERIEGGGPHAAEAAHMLKGAARAIGAFGVADAAEAVEHGRREEGVLLATRLAAVRTCIEALRSEAGDAA